MPMYVNSGTSQPVVTDSGSAAGGTSGANPKELALTVRGTGTPPYANAGTGPLGTNFCDYDAPTNNAGGYHFLCLSPSAQGGGLLSYGAAGGASQLPFQLMVNGAIIPLGGGSSNTFSDNITAMGNAQGNAVQLTGTTNAVTTVAAGSGARLFASYGGTQISAGFSLDIINAGANPLAVYPPSGQTINGGTLNAAATLYPNGNAFFVYRGLVDGTGDWYAR